MTRKDAPPPFCSKTRQTVPAVRYAQHAGVAAAAAQLRNCPARLTFLRLRLPQKASARALPSGFWSMQRGYTHRHRQHGHGIPFCEHGDAPPQRDPRSTRTEPMAESAHAYTIHTGGLCWTSHPPISPVQALPLAHEAEQPDPLPFLAVDLAAALQFEQPASPCRARSRMDKHGRSARIARTIREIAHGNTALIRTVNADSQAEKTPEDIVVQTRHFHAQAVQHPGLAVVV